MKVAFAIEAGDGLNAQVCPSFGRAPRFLIVDSKDNSTEVLENKAAQEAHGAGTGAAAMISKHGVQAIVAGRFGPKAFDALSAAEIAMYEAPADQTVKTVLEQIQAGTLKKL
jgi:predicted Fe-Mo cluster-binding NifX family protein